MLVGCATETTTTDVWCTHRHRRKYDSLDIVASNGAALVRTTYGMEATATTARWTQLFPARLQR